MFPSFSLSTPVKISLMIGSAALLIFGTSQLIQSYTNLKKIDEDDEHSSSTEHSSDEHSKEEEENEF